MTKPNKGDIVPNNRTPTYSSELTNFIRELQIPNKIFLKTAREFDDGYITNAVNKWTFDYSGSRRYLCFNQDDTSNKLTKYFCFKYASTRFPTHIPLLLLGWKYAIDYCKENGGFSITGLRSYLGTENISINTFYSVLFGLKILCAEEFPGFTIDDYEDLEFIPRPHSNSWGIYQEIDNVLDPLEKSMISKSLFEMGSDIHDGKLYQLKALRDAAILGLTYVTGARPVQLAKLAVRDFRLDTRSLNTGLIRYSILLPYAKQRRVTTERLFLAIPLEIGGLIMHYIERTQLAPDDKLFEMGSSAPEFVSNAINCAILTFSPPDYQAAVTRGEAAESIITPTDLRHNVGHSLAMQGASAEEIAHILGHSSLVAAKHYILATPALALIRAKALGVNPVWQNMVAMMLTGKLTSAQEWQGYRVTGVVGDQLHYDIGGCSRTDGKCPFCEVRCCYGCLYYRPFTDGDHQAVLDSVIKEVDELITISDGVGNARNPLISIHETTQFEIQSVIARCRFHKEKEAKNEKTL
ncbi:site-specific integrase [Pectobacterium carotovorum]|uniref:site-specific integrase n=1 Tax=Pectobacterium carotovorum TaxID=554 RepID=UPI0032EAEBCD